MKRSIVMHPFLFAVYPVLFLYSANMAQVEISEIYLPCAILLGLTVASFPIGRLIFRNNRKTGLLISLFWIFFFTFGRLYRPYRIAILLAFLASVYFIVASRKELRGLNSIMNFIAAALVGITVVNIGTVGFRRGGGAENIDNSVEADSAFDTAEHSAFRPDIYYIILDGYARQDILEKYYGFDNSDFLNYLEDKGFYVARKSRSNYAQTLLSLASSLNLRYNDSLPAVSGNDPGERQPLRGMVKNNRVIEFLRLYGYKSAAFPTGYSSTEINKADYYLKPGLYLNEFQNMLLGTTFAIAAMKQLKIYFLYDIHRNVIANIFRRLGRMPSYEGPIFVFAHIISPHPPFVFGPNGERVNRKSTIDLCDGSHFMKLEGADRDTYAESYLKQLKYVNKKIKVVIDEILSDSSRPCMIILQSDHGPGSLLNWENPDDTNLDERLSILNAYYFPDGDYGGLYGEITPVNTFRIIFNRYFGADYKLLKDESFFSTWNRPYEFINIDDRAERDGR